jgi:hypothetical protein
VKYFYDTEFHEDGRTIDLISIAIVAEDGREYYAVNQDADWGRIERHPWLMENVVPHLPPRSEWKSKSVIRNEVSEFTLPSPTDTPILWADYAAYDHVALCQLFGTMMDLPQHLPMWTHDLQHELERSWKTANAPEQESGLHDALEDARHLKRCYEHTFPQ